MSDQACIILNAASGRQKDEDGQRLDLSSLSGIATHRLESPKKLRTAVERAVADGYDPIIAAGGDGTVGGIAHTLVGTGRRLGLIPLGTFNYFARSLGIPEDPREALDVALTGEDRPLSVGEINGRIFLNNASLGAYAAVLQVREGIYKQWGRSRLAAYWSVIVAMATIYRPLSMRVTVDGEEHSFRSPMAFVSIRDYQLEEFGLAGSEAVREGKLALFVARDTGRLRLLWQAIRIFFRGARRNEDYVLLVGREIVIESKRRSRLVALDGERERMKGPYRFRVREDALLVRVPSGADDAD